jgi:cytochrome c6
LIPWPRLVSFLAALLLLLGLIVLPAALGVPGAALALAAPPPGPAGPEADVIDGSVLKLSVLDAGSSLFGAHCAGCHLQGGNIIRRGKTLKMAALERNGITSPDAIAAITITFNAGFASAEDVPGNIKEAFLLALSTNFTIRQDVLAGVTPVRVPGKARLLLDTERYVNL